MAATAHRGNEALAAGDIADEASARRYAARTTNDRLNAFIAMFDDVDQPPGGALSGVVYAAKDMFDLKGRAPSWGLARRDADAPQEDAALIRLMRAQGASLFGLTQMTALAFEPSGHNAALGRPLNPHDASYICGGSSSGSAVAVAAGLVPLAIGSDTAGSLRIPAHCCGISAWKPTHGLVPTQGAMPLAPSLDALGFLSRSATGFASLVQVFAPPGGPAGHHLHRFALAQDALGSLGRQLLDRLAACLTAMGCESRTTTVAPLLTACDGPVLSLLQGEAFRSHRALIESGRLDPLLAKRLEKGRGMDEAFLAGMRQSLAQIERTVLDQVFAADEVLVLPVLQGPTPRVSQCEPGHADFSARTLYDLSALTRFVNGLGLPAVSIPVGLDINGMPISLQLVARKGTDAALIGLAASLQARLEGALPT